MLVGAVGSSAFLLLVLACPIGMGLMMLFMGRGMTGGMKKKDGRESDADGASLAELKAEQARLAEKIEALQGQQSQPKATEAVSDRDADPVR